MRVSFAVTVTFLVLGTFAMGTTIDTKGTDVPPQRTSSLKRWANQLKLAIDTKSRNHFRSPLSPPLLTDDSRQPSATTDTLSPFNFESSKQTRTALPVFDFLKKQLGKVRVLRRRPLAKDVTQDGSSGLYEIDPEELAEAQAMFLESSVWKAINDDHDELPPQPTDDLMIPPWEVDPAVGNADSDRRGPEEVIKELNNGLTNYFTTTSPEDRLRDLAIMREFDPTNSANTNVCMLKALVDCDREEASKNDLTSN